MSAVVTPDVGTELDPNRLYYDENGYAVFPGLLPETTVDQLLERYRRDILPSEDKFFRQNTDHYERNRFNEHGYVIQSFLDIHAYASYPEFQQAALQAFFAPQIQRALTVLTGDARHRLMQTMLFDLNAATRPHQDWWYLDSYPCGHLLGAWIALEDIAEDAGRFYVLPKSQHTRLDEEGLPHSRWLERMREHLAAHQVEVRAPALKKGDVLFWNSRTIHGALPTRDPSLSRKSLTAHFLPASLGYGNLFGPKPWVKLNEWQGHEWFANQPQYSLKADLASRVKLAVYDSPTLIKLARKLQRRSIAEL